MDNSPGLRVGDHAPDATLISSEGKTVRLADLYAAGPVVLVFYRGGWCPYCNRHLHDWVSKAGDLKQAGATLVAISPERPEKADETIARNSVPFLVLSDTKLEAARAYKLVFTLDQDTQKKYKGFGVDLTTWNSSGTWELPAPGTFVVNRDGVVHFAEANWDYKVRTPPDKVIEAVKAMH
jgi:peroxiredoxin